MQFTQNELDYANFMLGSCNSYCGDEFGLDYDRAAQVLRNLGIFRCACCSWWCDEGDKTFVDDEEVCHGCFEEAILNV